MGCWNSGRSGRARRGLTLVECMIAVAICSVIFLGTISALTFARQSNELEQERTRAHQIVTEALELEIFKLFTWTASGSEKTIWDNGTEDPADDTVGTLEVIVRDPKTQAVLMSSPDPATMVQVEATITWKPRVAALSKKSFRETVMTYKAP